MEIKYIKIDELKPYAKNPRLNDEAVKYVKNSIKEFGFKNPILIDKDNTIIAGHTRLKAAKDLKLEKVPTIKVDDLTDEQVKAFRIADNKVSEIADWNELLLDEELKEILEIDMSDFGFTAEDILEEPEENLYTTKVDIPQYDIQGVEYEANELVETDKADELLAEIECSGVSDEEKDFLKKATARHLRFNYSKIAEYYAGASKEMQELMEKNALVLVDIDNAIRNGYVELENKTRELLEAEIEL